MTLIVFRYFSKNFKPLIFKWIAITNTISSTMKNKGRIFFLPWIENKIFFNVCVACNVFSTVIGINN